MVSRNGVLHGSLGSLTLPVRADAPILTWQTEGVFEGVPPKAKPGVGPSKLATAMLYLTTMQALLTDAC